MDEKDPIKNARAHLLRFVQALRDRADYGKIPAVKLSAFELNEIANALEKQYAQ